MSCPRSLFNYHRGLFRIHWNHRSGKEWKRACISHTHPTSRGYRVSAHAAYRISRAPGAVLRAEAAFCTWRPGTHSSSITRSNGSILICHRACTDELCQLHTRAPPNAICDRINDSSMPFRFTCEKRRANGRNPARTRTRGWLNLN